jgi:predicted SprT family Zn-dependent metalloprotease
MVCCNLCGKNKRIEEFKEGLRYICKECWEKLEFYFEGERIDKEIIY